MFIACCREFLYRRAKLIFRCSRRTVQIFQLPNTFLGFLSSCIGPRDLFLCALHVMRRILQLGTNFA